MKNYYHILNIPRTAEKSDIRRAFRELALVLHPDVADESHTEAFIQAREAYEVLINDLRRQAYDVELDARANMSQRVERSPFSKRSGSGTASPSDHHKVFSKKKASSAHQFSPKFTQQPIRQHYEAQLIAAEESACRPIDIPGLLEISLEDTLKTSIYTVTLAHEINNPEATRKYKVQIPGKLYEGAFLRVKGLGYNTAGGIGDLIIEVNLAKHPVLRVCGDSIFYDVTLSPWHAALGHDLTIHTLEGPLKVTAPPILCPPQMKRLQGHGIYNAQGRRGDLWINFKIEIDPPTSFRARRLWAELAEEYKRIHQSGS